MFTCSIQKLGENIFFAWDTLLIVSSINVYPWLSSVFSCLPLQHLTQNIPVNHCLFFITVLIRFAPSSCWKPNKHQPPGKYRDQVGFVEDGMKIIWTWARKGSRVVGILIQHLVEGFEWQVVSHRTCYSIPQQPLLQCYTSNLLVFNFS